MPVFPGVFFFKLGFVHGSLLANSLATSSAVPWYGFENFKGRRNPLNVNPKVCISFNKELLILILSN